MSQARENGQGLVEYALILVLMVLVIIVVLELFGVSVSDLFTHINGVLDSV